MKKRKRTLTNVLITFLVLAVCFGVSILLQSLLDIKDHINTVFVFGVFLVSLFTEGYIFGISAAFIGALAVNFVAYPFLAFNFADPENVLSAIIMIVLALMTCGLTTRLKQWQELKAEGDREMMRANLLRAVSHDLRTPLTTIYGSASAIADNPESLTDEQKQKLVIGIRDDSEWLIRMVENLLSVTKLDSANVQLLKSPTVVDELIDSVAAKFKKRFLDQPLEISLPDEIVIVPMDPILIDQVISNLLENAVYHAKGMTKLNLNVRCDGDRVLFEIIDDGCGIDPDKLNSIFTGLYSNTEFNDNGRRNSGIGLSVCATIIKAHGGYIEAENFKEGGALFRFSLKAEEDLNYVEQ